MKIFELFDMFDKEIGLDTIYEKYKNSLSVNKINNLYLSYKIYTHKLPKEKTTTYKSTVKLINKDKDIDYICSKLEITKSIYTKYYNTYAIILQLNDLVGTYKPRKNFFQDNINIDIVLNKTIYKNIICRHIAKNNKNSNELTDNNTESLQIQEQDLLDTKTPVSADKSDIAITNSKYNDQDIISNILTTNNNSYEAELNNVISKYQNIVADLRYLNDAVQELKTYYNEIGDFNVLQQKYLHGLESCTTVKDFTEASLNLYELRKNRRVAKYRYFMSESILNFLKSNRLHSDQLLALADEIANAITTFDKQEEYNELCFNEITNNDENKKLTVD